MLQDDNVRHINSTITLFSLTKKPSPKRPFPPLPSKKNHFHVSEKNSIRTHSFHASFNLIIHHHTLGMKLPEGVVALKSLEDSGAHCFSV